ncbi:MAG: 50S ribosomal protein L19 [Parcubacteria group bacterium]
MAENNQQPAATAAPAVEKKIDRNFPLVKAGTVVAVHQEISEINAKGEEKKRIQTFEGVVIERNHGKQAGATITVRKVSDGVGVEKIYPLNLPTVKDIEVVKQQKVRRAKLHYLREAHKKMKEGANKKE